MPYDRGMFKAPELMKVGANEAVLLSNGDERNSANRVCWPEQENLERQLSDAFSREGWKLTRAHGYDPALGHGFIESQKQGDEVFDRIPRDAPVVVAEAVWQYSNQVAYRLWEHEGPILIASNFDGTWPGLVGALGLKSCLTKHKYKPNQKGASLLWSSEGFEDADSKQRLGQFLREGKIDYDTSHAVPFTEVDKKGYEDAVSFGRYLGDNLRKKRARLGVFDPLCMGMLNAAFDEEALIDTGISLRRLNQSDLYAEMQQVPAERGLRYIEQLARWGMKIDWAKNRDSENTRTKLGKRELSEQGQMYEALLRIAHREGLDGVGLPYQLGLARLCAASDLMPEGAANSSKRPAVRYKGETLFNGEPLPVANEADMGCGVDQIMSKRVLQGMHLPPETTQHDLRWGDRYKGKYRGTDVDVDAFTWVWELSGNTPAEHVEGGWGGVTAVRQPYMYFKKGGAAMKAVCKPGEGVWSRVYIDRGELCMDIGRFGALALPQEETNRRWNATTKEWPILHGYTPGISRDQKMAKHGSNHLTVRYLPDAHTANQAMFALAGMGTEMGMRVNICGSYDVKDSVQYKLSNRLPIIN